MSLIKYPQVVDLSYELTQGFAARFIRYKATRLVGRAGLRPCDQEDVEQDLRLHLVQRFPRFDSKVAHWNAFVATVITRHVFTILAQRLRRKRRHALTLVSLNEIFGDVGDAGDDPETFAPEGYGAQLAVYDDMTQRDLAIDVEETLARLPRHRREFCKRLMNDTPSEVARQLHVPRTTLCGRILSLREEFTASD